MVFNCFHLNPLIVLPNRTTCEPAQTPSRESLYGVGDRTRSQVGAVVKEERDTVHIMGAKAGGALHGPVMNPGELPKGPKLG